MKHIQTDRHCSLRLRAAQEAEHLALVITAKGLHSDVVVMTIGEAEKLFDELKELLPTPAKSSGK